MSNFRLTDVYPSDSEIFNKSRVQLKKNVPKGKFPNIEEYLDIQFKLLREDFVASIRKGFKCYFSGKQTKNIEIHPKIELKSDICYYLKLKPREDGTMNWGKIMNGSLLILTKDNFKTTFLAKMDQDYNDDDDDVVDRINIEIVKKKLKPSRGLYTVAECCIFFEPYYQVLRVLQTISSASFPMEKYIIHVDTSAVGRPKYLRSINLTNLGNKSLNDAQSVALKAALSQEFVVIQGPPGTGKTFLGVEIARILIENHRYWYNKTPMLVISHKNDAVDKFLEGLLPFTENLIRVGGQSKSEKLEPYNLRNQRNTDLISSFSSLSLRNKNFDIMSKALLVGMTTTCAARMKDTLDKLRCPIVIVEEAAEVLEAHVVAALTQYCQHLILLGDHQQLQPHTADDVIATKYHLGVSLFERMVNNGIQCYQLKVQHRMRPEISNLIRPTFYPFLVDHASVKKRPSIKGMVKNVLFIDHRHRETTCDVTSKKNTYEAKFLTSLARHLVLNGYESKTITIVATYKGQAEEFKKQVNLPSNEKYLKNVKISTLDGFQGQESEIVLLSLVRSDSIGFLATKNRICVSLSRAKNGFYMIGNMALLKKHSKIWATVEKCLQQQNALVSKLTLRCQNHPTTETQIGDLNDFNRVPHGGCNKKCNFKLQCGHLCDLFCHILDKKHEYYKCQEICGRKICTKHEEHRAKCRNKCSEECQPCTVEVTRRFLKCGHRVKVACSIKRCPMKHN